MGIGDGFSVELVGEFCYLGGTLEVDGDKNDAVTARICSGQFKFRSLVPFLTAKDVSFKLREKVSYDVHLSHLNKDYLLT